MKRIKAIACVLSAAMLVGIFAGCSKTTKINTENFVKACEKLGLDEHDPDESFNPEPDDLEDGIYTYADEDFIEDNPEAIESILADLRLDDVIDADDVTSFAIAAKCTGLEDAQDMKDPSDIADLEIDGAFAMQIQLADGGYAEDFMDYIDDMLDLVEINTKDLSNKEFYVSKNEGFFRFHVDMAKFAKIVLDNDDIMDFIDMNSDVDDFEDALNALTGDVAISVEINGGNIFVIVGGAVNSKTTVLDSFAKAFGAANNPKSIPMNNDVVAEVFDELIETYGRFLGLTAMVDTAVVVASTVFQIRI
ncbi:MAG: hypothetical protein IKO15_03905 [Clostridiales bacterium]|nr:hypothetical protein [Clostridiales bacterium]